MIMAEKPILFSEGMIKAVLEDRKRQTRRVIKLPSWSTDNWDDFEIGEFGEPLVICENTGCLAEIKSPYGQARDTLWVRERHAIECPYGPAKGCDNPDHIVYWATEEPVVRDSIIAKWRPSIHMPRWASRITLRVNEVRIERIQDITLEDILAEGCPTEHYPENNNGISHAAFGWFEYLWDSINAKRGYGWDKNPFVWVVDFDLIEPSKANDIAMINARKEETLVKLERMAETGQRLVDLLKGGEAAGGETGSVPHREC